MSEIERAVAALRRGGLVAFPTETVYGLGADASDPGALHHLYAVKRRPLDHPVIVHVGARADLGDYALAVPELAGRLAAAFWPGPLTLVLRRRPDRIAPAATGGRATVGLRVPAHPLALALLDAFDGAIAAPSANRFGKVSPTTADHVRADLGSDVDVVLDGGPCRVGVESTIVDLTGAEPAVLRVGGVPAERLEAVVGRPLEHRTAGEVAAPGTLASHYAPRARVEVVARGDVEASIAAHRAAGHRVALLALGAPVVDGTLVLESPRDVEEYARVLYARLRQADEEGVDVVVAVPPPDGGLGRAVADRLRRAAAG